MQWGYIKGSGAYSNHVAVDKYVVSSYGPTAECITPCSWFALQDKGDKANTKYKLYEKNQR